MFTSDGHSSVIATLRSIGCSALAYFPYMIERKADKVCTNIKTFTTANQHGSRAIICFAVACCLILPHFSGCR